MQDGGGMAGSVRDWAGSRGFRASLAAMDSRAHEILLAHSRYRSLGAPCSADRTAPRARRRVQGRVSGSWTDALG